VRACVCAGVLISLRLHGLPSDYVVYLTLTFLQWL